MWRKGRKEEEGLCRRTLEKERRRNEEERRRNEE